MLQEINNEINGVKFITTATKNTSHNDEKLACAKYNKISKIWLFQRKEKKLLVKKGIRFSVEMATQADIIAVLLIPCYTDSRFLWLSQIQNVSIQLWVLFRSKLESNWLQWQTWCLRACEYHKSNWYCKIFIIWGTKSPKNAAHGILPFLLQTPLVAFCCSRKQKALTVSEMWAATF